VADGLVDGVVLCRVGDARLALDCDEIDAIAEPEGHTWDVGVAFGVDGAGQGRALQFRGQLLKVDSIDVLATPGLVVLPVPAALTGVADGALTGFIEVLGALWPLVSSTLLLAHLEKRAGA